MYFTFLQSYSDGNTILSQGPLTKILLEPTVFLTLEKSPTYFVYYVILLYSLFMMVVFLYKKYVNVVKSGNRRQSLMKATINNVANLMNVKVCFVVCLFIFIMLNIKNYLASHASFGSRTFFWSWSAIIILMISHFPFWGNIALR